MANEYLLPVYKKLYNEDFNFYDFNMRMKMQKAVYLLQELGVPVGDYRYRWYLHGPYSQKLQDDMYDERENSAEEFSDSDEYAGMVEKLGKLFASEEKGSYSLADWAECLGSMYYLSKRVLPSGAGEDEVLSKLKAEKPHLKDDAANTAAHKLLKELFAV